MAAAMFPEVGAVVAYAPSSVAFAGIGSGRERRRSSWSYRGRPTPFVPYTRRVRPSLGLRGLSPARMYAAALDDAEAVVAAAIPIERSEAAIMLLSGGRDRMWPSSEMATTLVARLTEAGKADRVVELRFPDAGHSFMPWAPNLRVKFVGRLIDAVRLMGSGGLFDLGGRPRANRDALRSAWPQVVRFLADRLGPRGVENGAVV